MANRDPILTRPPAKGRPADRLAAIWSGLGLILASAATLWFFLGFYETDPEFRASSAAFLLSLGLGAFAIIPCAIGLKLGWISWRNGFRARYGLWVLLLFLPWIALALIATRSDWLPVWLTVFPLLIAIPLCLWAIISLWLERGN